MTDKTYNGWANHATLALKETIDNILTDYEDAKLSGLAADLINSALSDVDWYELADSYLEDCEVETEDNDDE